MLIVTDRANRIHRVPTINDTEIVEEIDYMGANIKSNANLFIELNRSCQNFHGKTA